MAKEQPKYKRKRPQLRSGLSGKFMPNMPITVHDLIRWRMYTKGDCMLRADNVTIGKIVKKTWQVWLPPDYHTTQKGQYKNVVTIIWEYHNHPLKSHERLKRTCKTAGCVNDLHYELKLKEDDMINLNQTRALYQKAMRDGIAILPLGNEAAAKKLRMNIYTRRSQLKTQDPMFFKDIADYGLFIEDGNLVCRPHGTDLDNLFAAAGIDAAPMHEVTPQEVAQRLKEVEAEEGDKMNTTIQDLGYGMPEHLKKDFSPAKKAAKYDYANPPEAGDDNYEDFVNWTLTPEGRAAYAEHEKNENEN